MKQKILNSVLAVIILLIGLCVVGIFVLDGIAQSVIQSKGSEGLGVPVKVDSVHVGFFGKDSNSVTRAKKAGQYLYREFNRSEQGQQRFPGRMIKAMAAFEIFYIDSLRKNKKSLERYRANKGKKYLRKSSDEKNIRSLISINKGREKEARRHLAKRAEVGWFTAEHFFSLGLLGTVFGLCVATSTSLNEGTEVSDIVAGLKQGLNTAFYTTICGIVFSLALQVQLMILRFKLEE